MGLAVALLGIGNRTVVASTLPVSDAHTGELVVRFHTHPRDGEPPAAALARAQAGIGDRSTEDRVTAGSFVCLGRG